MSPLWRDELRVLLTPTSAALVQIGHSPWPRVVFKSTFDFEASASRAAAWRPALAALESALEARLPRRARLTVVLSNHFVRYLTLVWDDALDGDEQDQAYARHQFRLVHGDIADSWSFRSSPADGDAPRLVSAIDADLVEALRALTRRIGARLHSVQPYLMSRFNRCRAALGRGDGWLALAEPGLLCLARLEHGGWRRLRTMRVGDCWLEDLPFLLEREVLLDGGTAADVNRVFVSIAGVTTTTLPEDQRWSMTSIPASTRPVLPAGDDVRYAMALGG